MSKVLIRFWAYDRCLTNPVKKYTWDELVEKANYDLEEQGYKPIGKTQFFEDVKTLQRPPILAPISTRKEGRKSYYFYTDPNYKFRDQKLNVLEADQIKSALMVMSRFKGLPQFEWVHEIIPKIETQFRLENKQSDVIGFDQNIDLKGLDHFDELFNSIVNKQPLSIRYKSFKSKESSQILIHPYFLKQYNNRWFLFGFNPKYSDLNNLALDRIEEITTLDKEAYIENTFSDFNEYFEDMIGVTKYEDRESQLIKLWFESEQAHYIDTKPLHGTQKLTWQSDGSAIVTIEVIPYMELEHLLLRFGEKCKVLEPIELVSKISERLKLASDSYH